MQDQNHPSSNNPDRAGAQIASPEELREQALRQFQQEQLRQAELQRQQQLLQQKRQEALLKQKQAELLKQKQEELLRQKQEELLKLKQAELLKQKQEELLRQKQAERLRQQQELLRQQQAAAQQQNVTPPQMPSQDPQEQLEQQRKLQEAIAQRAHEQVIPEVAPKPPAAPAGQPAQASDTVQAAEAADASEAAQTSETIEEAQVAPEEAEEPEAPAKEKRFSKLLKRRSSKKQEDLPEEEPHRDRMQEVQEQLEQAYVKPPGEGESDEEFAHRNGYHEPTVGQEIRSLALKIVYVLVAFFIVFTFIFGLHRNLSAGMQPSLRDGDLLFYYRLDHDYRANNVVVFEYQDELIASRVIAVEGDTVNISEQGLEINGHVMYEPEIYSKTTQFKNGPTFPLTVEHDTVFCLGDNREHANDSRIIGLIETDDIKGKVMGVIRRRNL